MATYRTAAQILDRALSKKGSVKSLVITSKHSNKRKLYALVCETLKYRTVIEEILEKTKFEKHERKVKHTYALVLVYDFLFGAGLQCGGALKEAIVRNKSSLQSALARLKVKAGVSRNEDLLPKSVKTSANLPRYVRVNTIKTTVGEVLQHFEQEGYKVAPPDNPSCKQECAEPVPEIVHKDRHLKEVLVFPPATDLHAHPLYTHGRILLQDKASCFPAHVLHPAAGSHVIDACAAPGNKTSHMASLMRNEGKIFAFDISSRRLTTLEKMMATAGVTCVETKNCSFLDVNPSDARYSKVECILVDPSCSGSGIVSRMDCLVDDETELADRETRLASLSKFQLKALLHAFSFPAARRVVYSTCSLHQEENEDVVRRALESTNGEFGLDHALPTWSHRGNPVFPEAVKCIRASAEEDATNGFFVALFVRKSVAERSTVGEQKQAFQRQTQRHADNQPTRAKDPAVTSVGTTSGRVQNGRKGFASDSEIPTVLTSSMDTSSGRVQKRQKVGSAPVISGAVFGSTKAPSRRRRKRKRSNGANTSRGTDTNAAALSAVIPPFVNSSKKRKKNKHKRNAKVPKKISEGE